MKQMHLARRRVLSLGFVGLSLWLSGCAGVTPAPNWPGVGTMGSGPEAGCPTIMSYFDDWRKKYGQLTRTGGGWNVPHSGIDFDVSVGTPVLAVAPGVVIDIWDGVIPAGEAGIFTVVYHGQDADEKHAFSFYAHLSEQLKKPGDRVERGEFIALSGSTGTMFPHLHLSLFRTAVGRDRSSNPP